MGAVPGCRDRRWARDRLPLPLASPAGEGDHPTGKDSPYNWEPHPAFILDLYCPQAGLAVEVDGGQRSDPEHAARDQERTAFLSSRGIRVLRLGRIYTDRRDRRNRPLRGADRVVRMAIRRPDHCNSRRHGPRSRPDRTEDSGVRRHRWRRQAPRRTRPGPTGPGA
ncbi:MAG: DUF559 domain-containing protein [Myxococcales bacterium]|nr:DUF559 domain-containing protein [Myxococcales bacterium]